MDDASDELLDDIKTSAELPEWGVLIKRDPQWLWRDGRLFHCKAQTICPTSYKPLHTFWMTLYANQDNSKAVKAAVKRTLSVLSPGEWGLDLGAGGRKLHERLITIDLTPSQTTDIVTYGLALPFKDACLSVIISQEVLEHICDPFFTIDEVHRVLKPGGLFYCQVPFQIGHHSDKDYWRFSKDALRYIFQSERFEIVDLGISVGHGTGFYRIAVEYLAINASILHRNLYFPMKFVSALFLLPFRWVDHLSRFSDQKDRIAGGYYCIARKRT
jgi:SAM-dependent methyltransferase